MTSPNAQLAEMARQIAELTAQNAKLKDQAKAQERAMTMSVSAKGALSLYGLGRFPVTLYVGAWRKILTQAQTISNFIDEGVKLGAFATSMDQPFVQPNSLPLKFKAKQAADAPKSAASSDAL
jgi:hypothetical protein